MIDKIDHKTLLTIMTKNGHRIDLYYHPETREGEIYTGNYTREDFELSGWKTKRVGLIAYNTLGERITARDYPTHLFPGFIQLKEMEEKFDTKAIPVDKGDNDA